MVSGLWHPANCYGFPTSTWSCQNVKTCSLAQKQKSVCTLSPPAALRVTQMEACCLCDSAHAKNVEHLPTSEVRYSLFIFQFWIKAYNWSLSIFFPLNGILLYFSGFTHSQWCHEAVNRHHNRPAESDAPWNRRTRREVSSPLCGLLSPDWLIDTSGPKYMGLSCPTGPLVNEG